MNKEIYFVVSDGDAPIKICFDMESAKKEECLYIDSFDVEGNLITPYIWDCNACEYVKWNS